MKIGLVRHFAVEHAMPSQRLLSREQMIDWFAGYDACTNLRQKAVDLGTTPWQRCFASPMPRALQTAQAITQLQVEQVPALTELNILHRLPGRIRLPFLVWGSLVRIKSFARNEDTANFESAIYAFVQKLVAEQSGPTLVVSHWFVMRTMQKALLAHGFTSQGGNEIENGVLYLFERSDSA